jgi:hypothetical protein
LVAKTATDRNVEGRRRHRAARSNWLKIGAVALCGAAALTAVPDASAAAVTWTTTGVTGSSSVYIVSPNSNGICKLGANFRFTDEEGSKIQTLYFNQANCVGNDSVRCTGFVPTSSGDAIPVFDVVRCEWVS